MTSVEYRGLALRVNGIPTKQAILDAFRAERRGRVPRYQASSAPLTPAQLQVWLHERFGAGHAYVVPIDLEVTGVNDVAMMQLAVDDVVDRHPALRLRVEPAPDGTVHQHVVDRTRSVCDAADLLAVPEDRRDLALREVQQRTWRWPMDLHSELPVRFVACRTGVGVLRIIGAIHHLSFDARSAEVFQRDLLTCVVARMRGASPSLPCLRRDTFDFALWLREREEEGDFAEAQRDLDELLAGAPAALELPGDRVRPDEVRFAGDVVRRRLSRSVWQAVRSFARRAEVTPFCVLATAYGCVLGRTAGQDDVVLGTPLFGRTDPALLDLVGFFVNTLPLRLRLASTRTFLQLVRETAEVQRKLQVHSDYSLASMLATRGKAREVGRTPVFQTLVTFREAAQRLVADGVEIHARAVPVSMAKFEVSVVFEANADDLEMIADYQTTVYESGSIDELLARLESFLANACSRLEVPIDDIDWLSPSDALALVRRYNRAGRPSPEHATVHQRFEVCVDADPTRGAVTDAAGTWSYGDLEAMSNGVAAELVERGVKRGECVLLLADKSVHAIAGMLGIMKAGAAYVPVEASDPSARRAEISRASSARWVLATNGLIERATECGVEVMALESISRSAARISTAMHASEPINVLFTSGSTGTPKGVLLPHQGLLRLIQDNNFCALERDDVTLQISPLNFDGHTFEIWATLGNGGRLVLVDKATVLSTRELSSLLARERVTVMVVITALLNRLIEEVPDSLRGLRKIVFGGEMVSMPHISRALALCQPDALVHTYGPTECSFTACHHVVKHVDHELPTIPIGGPVTNTEIYLLDHRLRPVPLGVIGDLYLSGDGLATCYLGDEDRTRATFIDNPFAHDRATSRMYRTGDRARRRRDGEIEFVGRIDNQIKIRSQRVELGEVEATLARHPQVGAAYVTFREVNGSKELLGYYVSTGGELLGEAVRDYLSAMLPDYMVPAHLVCVSSLPLKPNGKVDRAALPVPEVHRDRGEAPADGLETTIADLWRSVLERDQIGVTDNFFEVGGHSLLLLRLQKLVEAKLGREVPVVHFFRYPTIRAFSRALQPRTSVEAPSSLPAIRVVTDSTPSGGDAIAIVGLAIRAPGAYSADELWEHLAAGRELIERFTLDEVPEPLRSTFANSSRPWVGAAGVLDGVEQFDAKFFKIPTSEASVMDPQHRVFFDTAWAAIEDAAFDLERLRSSMSVYAGCSPRRAPFAGSQATDGAEALRHSVFSHPTFMATRFAYKMNLEGEAIMVDTACSTALVAVHLASRALLAGECNVALAGAVSIQEPQRGGYLHFDNYILSADGRCRPFDHLANGTVPASGCVVFALRRLSDALRDRDPIHAVILGSAVNNDGDAKIGFTAPSEDGQVRVIEQALRRARRQPGDVTFVETHGTGTALGDPIEVAALARVFASAPRGHRCVLGAVKGNLGHLGPAAGGVGLAKAVLQLKARTLAPTVHFTQPNPKLRLQQTPFDLLREAATWEVRPGSRRCAGVSSFGIGGTNVHLILEEAP